MTELEWYRSQVLTELSSAAPHLGMTAAETLWGRYLGQVCWKEICQATDVSYTSLRDWV